MDGPYLWDEFDLLRCLAVRDELRFELCATPVSALR